MAFSSAKTGAVSTTNRVAAPAGKAMQTVTSSSPVEIVAMDGQKFMVSMEEVRSLICANATPTECRIFLETCKQYHLNPFTKEAYLIHYDNNRADSPSTIVLGKSCYLKMAENHPQFDGFEAGVIVLDREVGELIHRDGSIVYEGEQLLGGWAKVYRKDRSRPTMDEVKLAEYNTGKSQWAKMPATMIRKVALVHALREAFPSTFGSLYDESEVSVDAEAEYREIEPEQPQWNRRQPKKKAVQPEPLAVSNPEDDILDDPFVDAEAGDPE